MRTLVVLFLLVVVAFAQENEAADKVLAAFKAKDAAALKALAEKDNPDPWLVADELCFRGEHDAAEAFAKAAPRKDTEKLPAYVASRRGKRPNKAARAALAAAHKALAAGDANAAVAASRAVDAKAVDVVSLRLLSARSAALHSLRRLEESSTAALAAADGAERRGWLAFAASAYARGGYSAYVRSDWRAASTAWERRLAIEKSRGKRGDVAGALVNLGNIHMRRGAYAKALECYEEGLKRAEAIGHRRWMANALTNMGNIHLNRGAFRKALEYQERALKLKTEMGDRAGAAAILARAGTIHRRLGDLAKALDCLERSLEIYEELRDPTGLAFCLINLGGVHRDSGSYEKALEFCEKGLKQAEALGRRVWVADALTTLGNIHENLGSYGKALDHQKRSLKVYEDLGYRAGVAASLLNIGDIHRSLGSYAQALDYQKRSLKLYEDLGDRAGVATALGNIGLVHWQLGSYAKALECQERSLKVREELGDRAGVAATLLNIGNIHASLGSHVKALVHLERAQRLSEELGDRAGVATALVNVSLLHAYLGNHSKALDSQERALKLMQDLGDRAGVARTLGNLGNIHQRLGAHKTALGYYERVLKLMQDLGDRAGVARTLGNLGNIHHGLGAHTTALGYYERAEALAADLGSLENEVIALSGLASIRLGLGVPAEAARAARSGVAKLPLLVEGLAEEQGAAARDQWAALLETGVRAGMQLEDASEVSFFIESGRAGGLLESLGGRKTLRAAMPEELQREETAARAAVLAAQARHGRALEAGDRTGIRTAHTELDAARDKVLDVVARIQRSAKAVADVVYPEAAPLEKIQAALGPDETLVSYAVLEDVTVALVVTNKKARVVELGKTGDVEAALETVTKVTLGRWRGGDRSGDLSRGFKLGDRGVDPSAEFKVLRRKLIVALGLDPAAKRLLVSPAGALSYLPFAVLAPEYEVLYVPSGTTYTVLRDDRDKRGKGVLALGDIPKRSASVYAGALKRLPATRVEAEAVGDVVLLDKRATEAALLGSVKETKRWRAVHLACHGVVNTARPQLSALALAPNAGDDGFLTVLEVFQARIPADLVVLSACETAKGKVFKAEGVIGFTRAFMLAGAPRVIVSLWKVDDIATKALMVKFYELWKPGTMATATALKQAQEFVRGHEKWKHPYYWAAWQLWGLGD